MIRWVDEISYHSFAASRPTDEMLRSGSVMKMPSGTISGGSFSKQHVNDKVTMSPTAAEAHQHAASDTVRSHVPRQPRKQILRKIARLLSLGGSEKSASDGYDSDSNDDDSKPKPLGPLSLRRRTATSSLDVVKFQQCHQLCDDGKTSYQKTVTLKKQHKYTFGGLEKRRVGKSPSISNYAHDSRRQLDSFVNRQPTKVDAVDVLGHNRRATGSISIRPMTITRQISDT